MLPRAVFIRSLFSFLLMTIMTTVVTGLLLGCAQVERVAKDAGLKAPANERPAFRPAWIKNLDPPHQTGNLPIGVGSPLIVEDLLYMGSLDGKMRAYKLENGRLIWEVDDSQPINARPALFEDMVIYGTMEGRIFARNYLTGELKYAIDLGSPVETAPVVSAGRMFFHLRDHKMIALDAATGKVFWSYKRSVPFTTTLQRVSNPLPYKNRLIVGFADGYIVSLSMEEGVVTWEQKISDGVKFVDVDVDPVYFNGFIVAGSAAGTMKFIDPENGMVARSVNLTIAHAPIKVKNSLVVGTVFGDVAIVDQDGEILKKKKLSADGVSSMVKWKEGYGVATMSGKVFYLNPLNLDVLGEFNLGHQQSAVFGHLQTSDDFLGLYSSRNRLYVFR